VEWMRQAHWLAVPVPGLDIASHRLRADLAEGRSVRYLVPDAVLEYIRLRRLYGAEGR